MAKAAKKRVIIPLDEVQYAIKETLMQEKFSPKEAVELLKKWMPYFKAKLLPNGDIEIDDD